MPFRPTLPFSLDRPLGAALLVVLLYATWIKYLIDHPAVIAIEAALRLAVIVLFAISVFSGKGRVEAPRLPLPIILGWSLGTGVVLVLVAWWLPRLFLAETLFDYFYPIVRFPPGTSVPADPSLDHFSYLTLILYSGVSPLIVTGERLMVGLLWGALVVTSEEVVFRRAVLDAADRAGIAPWASVIASSVLFCAFYALEGLVDVLLALTYGIVLATATRWTGSVVVPIMGRYVTYAAILVSGRFDWLPNSLLSSS